MGFGFSGRRGGAAFLEYRGGKVEFLAGLKGRKRYVLSLHKNLCLMFLFLFELVEFSKLLLLLAVPVTDSDLEVAASRSLSGDSSF